MKEAHFISLEFVDICKATEILNKYYYKNLYYLKKAKYNTKSKSSWSI